MTEKDYENYVREFGAIKVERLVYNGYKGDNWGDMGFMWLLDRLEDEVKELRAAMSQPMVNFSDVMEECGDVSNYAMFIANNAKHKSF